MNTEFSRIGGIDVEIFRKKIKNMHIGCYPPNGRVRVAVPESVSDEAIMIAVLLRMPWIKRKQVQFLNQERQPQRRYISGETHFLFGRPLRLEVVKLDKRVHRISQLGSDRLLFKVPIDSETDQLRCWMDAWLKAELRKLARPRIAAWSDRLGVRFEKWGIRPMKTKWGSCNPARGIVWLNSELAKKPERTIDYVIVHELAHLVSPRHDQRFKAVLDKEIPCWKQVRQELNSLPLPAWKN